MTNPLTPFVDLSRNKTLDIARFRNGRTINILTSEAHGSDWRSRPAVAEYHRTYLWVKNIEREGKQNFTGADSDLQEARKILSAISTTNAPGDFELFDGNARRK